MPINPNIIMQAGQGVTPIRRQDPYKEAAFGMQVTAHRDRQNSLKDKAKKDADKQMAQRVWSQLGSVRSAEDYASVYEEQIRTNPEAQGRMPTPDEWTPELNQRLMGGLKATFLDGGALVSDANSARDFGATQDHRKSQRELETRKMDQSQSNADRAYQLNRDKFNHEKNKPGSNGVSVGWDEDGRPVVQVGGSARSSLATVPPDKKIVKDAQEGIQEAWGTVGRLERIAQTYKPEFLTYQGRAKAAIGDIKDKAGFSNKEDRKFIGARRKFTQNVEFEFNAYRKLITGAAAAVQELEALKKAALNTDLGPAEFEAAFSEYVEEVKRGMRIKQRLLREGIRVGEKGFGEAFDRLYIGSEDDDIATRAKELEASGLGESEGIARLKAEGYM